MTWYGRGRFLSTSSARRTTRCRSPASVLACLFLSTSSARRTTSPRSWRPCRSGYFYPRPPRGGRRIPAVLGGNWTYFYPRPPRGGRRRASSPASRPTTISIHVLREEDDAMSDSLFGGIEISIHVLREEDDPHALLFEFAGDQFLSTSSARRTTVALIHR